MNYINKEKAFFKYLLKGILVSNIALVIFGMLFMGIMFAGSVEEDSGSGNGDLAMGGVPVEFVSYFDEASEVFNIPNWCLAAVAKQESNFNPKAEYLGAYGIMQKQKIDPGSGKDLWKYLIDLGLGQVYKDNGYSFNTSEEMWNIFLNDPKAQIFAGAYEIRYYTNYVLFKQNKVEYLEYNNNENMELINWKSEENNKEFKDTVRRIFACYNGGAGYGMSVDLDGAEHNYPNKVFKYAIEFRNNGMITSGNEVIEKSIEAGMKWVGKSPYVWGGGRNQSDVDAGRFDCSSFVHYMFSSAGVQLGDRGSVVTFSLVNMGEKIDAKDMKRGDVIFFDTYTTDGHVGVYLGADKFIHDGPTNGVEVSNIKSPYWIDTFNGKVRRVIKSNE